MLYVDVSSLNLLFLSPSCAFVPLHFVLCALCFVLLYFCIFVLCAAFVICTFVLLYFCTVDFGLCAFVLLCFCAFVLLCFCAFVLCASTDR